MVCVHQTLIQVHTHEPARVVGHYPTFSAALALILAAELVSASASLSSRSQSPQLRRQLARIHALAAHGVACARWSSCLASSAQPLKSSKGANGAAGPG